MAPRQLNLAPARAFGIAGALASCLPMVAMLPSGFAAVLGFVGLGSSSAAPTALAPHLDSVAQPLLLVSAAVLAVANLRCGLLVVATAAGGGLLLYLGMYVVTRPDGTTTPSLFYAGLLLFLGTYPVSFLRRRRVACRPLVDPRRGRSLLLATFALGLSIVVASAVAGFGAASSASPAHQGVGPGARMGLMLR